MLPRLGLSSSLGAVVVVNVLIGIGALGLARRFAGRERSLEAESSTAPLEGVTRFSRAAFLFGASALVLHMLWARELSVVLGGTTYSFTAMLVVVLIGIGVGSLLVDLFGDRVQSARTLLVFLSAGLALSTVMAQFAVPTLASIAGAVRAQRASGTFNALFCSGCSGVLEFVPALCSGALLPALVRVVGERDLDAGRVVGRIVAWNTLGATLGASLTAVAVLPYLGTSAGVALACFLAVLGAVLAVGVRPFVSVVPALMLVVSGGLAVVRIATFDPRDSELGAYLYGAEAVQEIRDSEVLFHEEGALANVLVTRFGDEISLRVNGKVDASTGAADMVTQVGAAYFPRFLKPDAKRVLVVGYGSGATAGASLLFPGTEVTCVEIEPAVVRGAEHFHAVNHRPTDSPGFELVLDDARSTIEAGDSKFDLIITEPSNPWMPGISNLFTEEFYRAVDERLEAEGHVAQWVQTYALSVEDYARVVQTLSKVFPNVCLVRLGLGDTLLIASHSELLPTSGQIDELQRRILGLPAIRKDLVRYFGTEDLRTLLMGHVMLGESVRSLGSESTLLHSDDNLRLEFDAARQLFAKGELPGAGSRHLIRAFLEALDPSFQSELHARLGGRPEHWEAVRELAALAASLDREDRARDLIEAALKAAPGKGTLLADRMLYAEGEGHTQAELDASLVELIGASRVEAARVANVFASRAEYDAALEIYDRLLEGGESSATLLANRAMVLFELGREDQARRDLARAKELDPWNETVRRAERALPTRND